jgi:hypothetical protein
VGGWVGGWVRKWERERKKRESGYNMDKDLNVEIEMDIDTHILCILSIIRLCTSAHAHTQQTHTNTPFVAAVACSNNDFKAQSLT